jgi:hypothetical protein
MKICRVISDTSKAPHSFTSGTTRPHSVTSQKTWILKHLQAEKWVLLLQHYPHTQIFNFQAQTGTVPSFLKWTWTIKGKKKALRVTLNKITITTILLNIRIHPRRGHEGPEGEWRYSPTLSLTLALDEGRQSTHAPAALPLGMTWYPSYRKLGGPQGWTGQVQKISPPLGFNPQTIQPVVSHYTDWAIRAHITKYIKNMIPTPRKVYSYKYAIQMCINLYDKPSWLLL